MRQIAQRLWNLIAPEARHATWKHLFGLTPHDLTPALEKLDNVLAKQEPDPVVRLAYRELAPLLQERPAIETFLRRHPEWSDAIPEVLSTNEAISMAVTDYRLTVSQTRALRKLLDAPPPEI